MLILTAIAQSWLHACARFSATFNCFTTDKSANSLAAYTSITVINYLLQVTLHCSNCRLRYSAARHGSEETHAAAVRILHTTEPSCMKLPNTIAAISSLRDAVVMDEQHR
jgi:hypothetical protein